MAAVVASVRRTSAAAPFRGGRQRRTHADSGPTRQLLVPLATALGGLSAACGTTLLLRRLAGAIAGQSGVAGICAATFVGIVLVVLADLSLAWGVSHNRSSRQSLGRVGARWLARLGLALTLSALLPAPSEWSGVDRLWPAFCLVAAVATVISPALWPSTGGGRTRAPPGRAAPESRREPGRSGNQRSGDHRQHPSPAPRTDSPPNTPPRQSLGSTAECSLPITTPLGPALLPSTSGEKAGILAWHASAMPGNGIPQQRFERFQLPDKALECVRATLHLAVAAGARTATGHIGFCPPFPYLPIVEIGTRDESIEAAVLATEVLPWGVRIECRLDEPADEPFDIPIDIFAHAPLHSAATVAAPQHSEDRSILRPLEPGRPGWGPMPSP